MFINKALLTPALFSLTVLGTVGCTAIPAPAPTTQPQLVFSCSTDSKKVISVNKVNGDFDYSYGMAGKPAEMQLTNTLSEVIKTPWNGNGDRRSQSIGFTNGSTTYSVYSSYAREANGNVIGGVLVEQSGKDKKINVRCNSSTIVDNIDSFVK